MRAHHGTITVGSELGRGSSFRIFLPSSDPLEVPVRSGGRVSPGTTLVVDDDEAVRNTLSRLLEQAGYTALSASSGEEALLIARARGNEINVFLVDVSMPGLTGPEVFDSIREMIPDAKVILMSGYNHVDSVRRCASRGLLGFLQKPFMLEDFQALMESSQGE